MTSTNENQLVTGNRIAAGALAALGAASAIPIPLAQLDFAGFFNVFNIDSCDSPPALLVMAGVSGVLTTAVVALALAGAVLTFAGARKRANHPDRSSGRGSRHRTAALDSAGVVIGAAVLILGNSREPARVDHPVGTCSRRPA